MTISGTNLMDSTQISLSGQIQTSTQTMPLPPSIDGTTDGDSDDAKVSKGSQQMAKLKSLATSNPAEFKAATQKISDDLAAQAKNETDPQKAKMLTDLSDKFAEAAKSGNMDSLKFQPPKNSNPGMSSGAISQKYGGQQHRPGDLFSQIDGIVSNALSGVSTQTQTTSTTSSSVTDESNTTEASGNTST